MKQMTTWQQLNAGTAVIILLLLVGLGLAFWMEKASSFASVRKGALGEFSQRVKSDLARMNLAVFALSFDPKDGVETNRSIKRS